ncbi:hypothetical protein JGU71_29155 [Antrihabitans sp. YC3-6]|uniref:Insoluble domain protein n=1 Tax=Antrihabitans stalagmiti TaxID=2799499 RepID=A0A934U6Z3_9NOCA|nr:hypothetical protein [Antrihabitans stalagmiti]MBJ8342962.1 hypothetical protein [Antrihabitans stalagmiti]
MKNCSIFPSAGTLAQRAVVAVSLPLALAVGAAGTGIADPGQPGLTQDDDDAGQPGLTVTPPAPAPPATEPDVEQPVVERSYLLPDYPQLPARPAPEVYTGPAPAVQLEELHTPEPVAPVAPVETKPDELYLGDRSVIRPDWLPKEWGDRFNIETSTVQAAVNTFYRSIGVDDDRATVIAQSQIAGGLTGAVAAALVAGIPAAIVGAAVGAAFGAIAGGVVGTIALPLVGAGTGALAGAGIGAIVGAAALGIPVGVVAGVIGGFLGAGIAGALAAGSDVGPSEPKPAEPPNNSQSAPAPAPPITVPHQWIDQSVVVLDDVVPGVAETVEAVVDTIEQAPGGSGFVSTAKQTLSSMPPMPPLPAVPPIPAELVPLAEQLAPVGHHLTDLVGAVQHAAGL